MENQIRINGIMLQAVIFDMDGLIFDSERIVQRSWSAASKELGLPDVGSHIYHTIGFNLKRRTKYFYQVFGQDFPMDQFNLLTRKKFQEIYESEGVDKKPGVEELLRYLKEQGIKTAVATSSHRGYSQELLGNAGLVKYFDGFMYGDMVENAKPDPEIYLKACAAIHVSPEYSLALEDSPAGIEAAYAAGMIPVMIPDLVTPTDEVRNLCHRIETSLYDVRGWMMTCSTSKS